MCFRLRHILVELIVLTDFINCRSLTQHLRSDKNSCIFVQNLKLHDGYEVKRQRAKRNFGNEENNGPDLVSFPFQSGDECLFSG